MNIGALHSMAADLRANDLPRPGDSQVQLNRRRRAELAAITLEDIAGCGPVVEPSPPWFAAAVERWIEAGR